MPTANLTEPYYAVIFTSTTANLDGYADVAERMLRLASSQQGFLGLESARQELGITVSYWRSKADIAHWKANSEHLLAQRLGRAQFYASYQVRICKVEQEYGFEQDHNQQREP